MKLPVWQRRKPTAPSYVYPKSHLPPRLAFGMRLLLKAIESLSQFPKRCPLARENKYFSQEIRQLLYGRGRNSYRILFTILELPERATVRILHIRHASQQTLGEELG
ncbi:type II toxin-antitoxin system RelE/ParE family toxin [Moorena sp. SIOASIH]|uniref:type II toxin-antitoxin system RelE/ParE family toxin n=1 Tax=Moorena sp. SIOASIH TaxID=2607817 RepID=UPI0025CC19D7|nr:type II toxin-antitoxin system RelE/ParE family toxin [Moorena sp. SIOASIH]